MKLLVIITILFCNSAFASLTHANKELSSKLKHPVSLEYFPKERGPSSFIHGSPIGTCSKINNKFIIKINKIWWLDIDDKDKLSQILQLCTQK